jgi:hypothetical protein
MTEAHVQTFSFHELKRHAILLSLGEDPSSTTVTQVHDDLYKVAFVYTDVDGDKAMIASDYDLKEAILQFNNKGSVKVFCSVEIKDDDEPKAPSRESACESSTQTNRSAADSTTQTVHPSATAAAWASFSATTHDTAPSSATPSSFSANAPPASLRKKAPLQLHDAVESFVNAVATAVITVADHIQPPPPHTNTNTNTNTNTTPAGPLLFIHGRHTCDGCLTTPIIGTRFQAINLPDYDLCSQCKDNYKGFEIHFHTVELDRDRPFQERWQRRQAKMCGHVRRHRAHGARRRWGGDKLAPQQPPPGPPMDLAIAEAIRRSLEDAKKEEEKKQANAVMPTEDKEEEEEEKKATRSVSETKETCCEQAGNAEDSDDETTASMPGLTPMGFKYFVPGRVAVVKTKATACEENQAHEEDSGDETDASMPGMTPPVGFQFSAPKISPKLTKETGVAHEEDSDDENVDSMPGMIPVLPVKTTKETAGDKEQAEVAHEEDSDDETTASMPGLIPVLPVKPTKETAGDKEQAGVADKQESDDEIFGSMPELLTREYKVSDSMPGLATRVADEQESDDESADSTPGVVTRESKAFYAKASSAMSSVPKEVDIVSRGPELSFASDAEGSGEIAAVLGETLDRVAQAIDDLNLDLDRTPSGEQMEKEIEIDEDENSNMGQLTQDDDCDSWNMVADNDN